MTYGSDAEATISAYFARSICPCQRNHWQMLMGGTQRITASPNRCSSQLAMSCTKRPFRSRLSAAVLSASGSPDLAAAKVRVRFRSNRRPRTTASVTCAALQQNVRCNCELMLPQQWPHLHKSGLSAVCVFVTVKNTVCNRPKAVECIRSAYVERQCQLRALRTVALVKAVCQGWATAEVICIDVETAAHGWLKRRSHFTKKLNSRRITL